MVIGLVWGTFNDKREFWREQGEIFLDSGRGLYMKSLISVAVPGR